MNSFVIPNANDIRTTNRFTQWKTRTKIAPMAHLKDLDQASQTFLLNMDCPVFETRPWVIGPPLNQRRVAIVTTAGLHRRSDKAFLVATVPDQAKPIDYRVIPADVKAGDLVMSHTSTNFDRSGFQQDSNLVFPIDRLRELESDGVIGSVADFHYSFMGAVDPRLMRPAATRLATFLKDDRVNAVLLVPV
jgi:D-proline reductase (dithiol) PrdB